MADAPVSLPDSFPPPPAEVQAAIHAGYMAWAEKRYADARDLLISAAAQAEAAGSAWGSMLARHHLANVLFNLREDDASRRLHTEILQEGLTLGFQWCIASSLANIGNVDAVESRIDDARAAYNEAIEIFTAAGHEDQAALVRRSLAYVERLAAEGRLQTAFSHLRPEPK